MPGSKSDLLRRLAAISGVKSATGGVRSSVLDWRKGCPLNGIDLASQITDVRDVPLIWPISQIESYVCEVPTVPKPSGSAMKTVRLPPRPAPVARAIKTFAGRTDGPHRNPPAGTPQQASNDVAAEALRIAKNPPGIDPTKQHF
jgi:hypothetical protein